MADWYVSSAAYAAIAAFVPSAVYSVGNVVKPTAPIVNNRNAFRCTTAGTASTEPTWNSAANNNATITTGGVTFTNVTGQSTYAWSAAAGDIPTMLGAGTGNQRFAPGDRMFLSSDHSETGTSPYYGSGATGTVSFTGGQVLSVNRAGSVPPVTADLTAGASLTASSGNLTIESRFPCYFSGISFIQTSANNIQFNVTGAKTSYLDNCLLWLNTSNGGSNFSASNPATAILNNTRVRFGSIAQTFFSGSFPFELIWMNAPGAIVTAGSIPTNLFYPGGAGIHLVTMRGVDLSALTTGLVTNGGNNPGFKFLLDSCQIASGVVRYFGSGGTNTRELVELVNCYDATHFISESHSPAGDVTTEFSTTLSGGATDNVGTFSHKMVSGANVDADAQPLASFWMDTNYATTGSAKTATVEVASSSVLFNNDIRLLVEYEGTVGSSLASMVSSFPNPLTVPTPLSASAATWNNSPAQVAGNAFDPNFNPAGITLSNSNRTATARISSSDQTIRTAAPFNSGKIYYEITCNASGGNNTNVGLINQLAAAATWPGVTSNGYSYNRGGLVLTNNLLVTTIATVAVGDTVCVAVDITNQKIWFRVNGGSWDNTTDNPATNTGGFSLTALLAGNANVFPTVGCYYGTDQLTLNTGGTTFAQAVPAGFTTMSSALVGGPQRLQASFTPRTAGRVRAQVRLGRPSTTVYVNPQVTIS